MVIATGAAVAYRNVGEVVIDRPGKTVRETRISAPSIVPDARLERPERPSPPSHKTPPILPPCPEIDCVRHRLSPGWLALAELQSAEVGVGADRVLVSKGYIGEEDYLTELAAALDIAFEPLEDRSREACPFSDEGLIEAAHTGMLQLSIDGELHLIIAPRELTIRRLIETLQRNSKARHRVRLTTNERLARFVTRHASRLIGYRAAEALRSEKPTLSAGTGRRRSTSIAMLVAGLALFSIVAPGTAGIAVEVALGLIFIAWLALRLLGMFSPIPRHRKPPAEPDSGLPIYTIVVALYREAAAAKDLIAALRNLNYPAERLDIKLVLEADDRETQATLASMGLSAPFEIIMAPGDGPKTKPKALNTALQFARGKFIAVYDAEDRPEPDQLRLALDAFVAGDARLACVQARLTIDNTSDSWLTRLFTAEYAGLFDVFLPGLATWRLPLPLGGSSNHFRTAVLREVGAWDPYNVTEDADLGMRIARRGYRTAVIQSTTYEEAPARFGPWLRQRTRWCKGWMQTWLVHMRSPMLLKAELSWVGFSVFQLLVGGTVLAALVHSLFVTELLIEFALALTAGVATDLKAAGLHAVVLAVGYAVSIVIALVGLWRRKLLGCAWVLLLMPVYWLLLSLAAWRALFQLIGDPYRWEKTEHGLARTSRLAGRKTATIRPPRLTDTGAGPRRPLRASASC